VKYFAQHQKKQAENFNAPIVGHARDPMGGEVAYIYRFTVEQQ